MTLAPLPHLALVLLAAPALGQVGPADHPQDEIWRQEPIFACGGFSSQDARNDGGLGWFSETADNFEAKAGDEAGSLLFWGGYCTERGQEGNMRGFTIRFYTDDNGSPGDRIYEWDTFTFVERFNRNVNGLAMYSYSLELPAVFVVPDDGQYWMSIVAILDRGGDAVEPEWGWVAAGSINEPPAHQWIDDPGNFIEQGDDASFILYHVHCVPDINDDGVVDSDDFFAYLDAFAAGDQDICDINHSANCDGDDFFYFLDYFAQGCY